MASVAISDLEAILKNFYLGPIIEALNNQLEMVELFQKITVDWSGRQVVIPVHVSRSIGTAYKPEAGDLPDAGSQGHVDLNVTAKYLYGRFSLTGPAIASAKTTANSFATYVQTEMEGLVTDTKIRANQAMFTGGGCIGFIHERINLAVPGPHMFQSFTGNKDVGFALQELLPANNRLEIDVIGLDDYASLVTRTAATDFVTADMGLGTAGNLQVQLYGAGAQLDTSGITGDYSALVVARCVPEATGATVGGGAGVDVLGVYTTDALNTTRLAVEAEPIGLYGNLGEKSHFGVDRNVAANAPLRSTVQAIAPAVVTNSTMDFKRMQAMLDEIMVLGGDDPDCMYAHPGLRQEYSALLSFVSATNTSLSNDVNGKPGKGDPGFSGYAFNGIPLKMSRHCGKGILIFLNTKVWCVAELKSFSMADMDGNVLSRVSNRDEWEGFVSWYYNLVCKQPNRCAILTGITFPGQ